MFLQKRKVKNRNFFFYLGLLFCIACQQGKQVGAQELPKDRLYYSALNCLSLL